MRCSGALGGKLMGLEEVVSSCSTCRRRDRGLSNRRYPSSFMSHSSSTTTVAASLSTSRKIDVAGAAPKFVVFGGTGLLGSALVRRLASSGYPNTLLVPPREKLDLMDSASVRQYLSSERADMVIVAAGRVGGILDNINNPYDLIIQNTVIQANIAQAMADLDDGRVMFFGSSCMYPSDRTADGGIFDPQRHARAD